MTVISFTERFMGNYCHYENDVSSDLVTLANKLLLDTATPEGLVKRKDHAACSRYIIRVEIAGQGYYFKKYINHSLKVKIIQTLTGSMAKHSYRVSKQLLSKGVSVASPILCSEKRCVGLVAESIFVAKEIDGVEAVRAYRLEKEQSGKQLLLEKYRELGATLVTQGFYHLDYRLGNMMLSGCSLVLFDVDDIFYSPLVKLVSMMKMLSKINLMFLLGYQKGLFPEGVGCSITAKILSAQNAPSFIKWLVYKSAMAHSRKDFQRLRKDN